MENKNELKELKDLLSKLTIDSKSEEIHKIFKEVATELLTNYQIDTASGQYNIVEIEFYFYNSNHKDKTVHKHNLEAGIWRAHYSGLDITFKGGDKNSSYGGILIRGLKDTSKELDKSFINGPLRVLTTLFSGSSIDGDNKIKLVKSKSNNIESSSIISTTRNGIDEEKCFLSEDKEFSPNTNNYCYYSNENMDKWDKAYSKKRFTNANPR